MFKLSLPSAEALQSAAQALSSLLAGLIVAQGCNQLRRRMDFSNRGGGARSHAEQAANVR